MIEIFDSFEAMAPFRPDKSLLRADAEHLTRTIGPRHYQENPKGNQEAAAWLYSRLMSLGFEVEHYPGHDSYVAWPQGGPCKDTRLVGAHFDTVPDCPGADDNASAVVVLLEAARLVGPQADIAFAVFNREEDGLLGSHEVAETLAGRDQLPREVHILEMVGYSDNHPDTQRSPDGLPFTMPTTGDFLAIVGNGGLAKKVVETASLELPTLRVLGIEVPKEVSSNFLAMTTLHRSDHSPFWRAGVPATMWTDTAEFRNANYHKVFDTIETLNFDFMEKVAYLLLEVLDP
jgi:hypothetical protein